MAWMNTETTLGMNARRLLWRRRDIDIVMLGTWKVNGRVGALAL